MKFEEGVKRENIIGEWVFPYKMMNLFNLFNFIQFILYSSISDDVGFFFSLLFDNCFSSVHISIYVLWFYRWSCYCPPIKPIISPPFAYPVTSHYIPLHPVFTSRIGFVKIPQKPTHCERWGQKKTSFHERDAIAPQSNVGKEKKRNKEEINHYKYDTPKLTRISLKGKRYQRVKTGREGGRERERERKKKTSKQKHLYTHSPYAMMCDGVNCLCNQGIFLTCPSCGGPGGGLPAPRCSASMPDPLFLNTGAKCTITNHAQTPLTK